MRLLATLVSFLLFGAAYAQTPTPPTRALDGAGAPTFTRISSGNPPATAEGDFVIGPEYAAPPELTVKDGVPQGTVQQFTMDSKDSKFYPGIARDVFGTPDPNNPKTLIVETHPIDYKRTITVYIPAQYDPVTPRLSSSRTTAKVRRAGHGLPRILDNLIAQRRVPAMIAIMIQRRRRRPGPRARSRIRHDVRQVCRVHRGGSAAARGDTLRREAHARGEGPRDDGRQFRRSAAFTMAWNHPEWYRRVISYSGTFVNQQWPFNPATPGGAWEYHNSS